MEDERFEDLLSGVESLSPAQRRRLQSALMREPEAAVTLSAIEANVSEDRQCLHCGTPGAVSRGKARGLRRYQCKSCRKTFNAATGTPLQGLHNKEKWLAFGGCVAAGLTLQESAERCGFAFTTAFRWRHRLLGEQDQRKRKPCKAEAGGDRARGNGGRSPGVGRNKRGAPKPEGQ